LALAAAMVCAPSAGAATKVDTSAAIADPSAIGTTYPGTITLVNTTNGLDEPGNITLLSNSIQLTPSCSTISYPCDVPDPQVFFPNTPAHGRAGTSCDGTNFQVIGNNPATGRLMFAPTDADILTPPGTPGDTCVIDFTYSFAKAPRVDVSPAAGIQTYMLTQVSAANSLNGNGAEGIPQKGSSMVTVAPAAVPPVLPPVNPKKKNCKKIKSKKKKKKCKKSKKGKRTKRAKR
jgi:hypothetical protein